MDAARTPTLADSSAERLSPELVAHEINNPLSANLTAVAFARSKVRELLRHGDGPDLTELLEALDDAATAGERVAEAVSRLCNTPQAPVQRTRDAQERGAQSQTIRARARVLIIDDDELAARGLWRLLRKHDVTIVHRGEDAIDLVERESFDMIFCDLIMPGMTGMDVYEELVRRQPALAAKVTFITGGATSERAHEFTQRFSARLIRKPFDAEQVHDAVRASLESTERTIGTVAR